MDETKPKKMWRGTWPGYCDICHTDLTAATYFYDAATKYGPWALVCPECFINHCFGLGTGRGQKYDSKTLEKVGG